MKQSSRLTQSSEIMRVRRLGKSSAHPLLVLVALAQNSEQPSQFCIITGKKIGGAVQRNRVKRRLRAVIQNNLFRLKTGYLVVIITRSGVSDAPFAQIESVFMDLCRKTGVA
jgi:ribonuclease P protein component